YKFPTDQLKSEKDVLNFAAGLEKGAVSAYLGAVPLFTSRDLAKAAASILGNEAMHWALLLQALGEPADPVAFVSYAPLCRSAGVVGSDPGRSGELQHAAEIRCRSTLLPWWR